MSDKTLLISQSKSQHKNDLWDSVQGAEEALISFANMTVESMVGDWRLNGRSELKCDGRGRRRKGRMDVDAD